MAPGGSEGNNGSRQRTIDRRRLLGEQSAGDRQIDCVVN